MPDAVVPRIEARVAAVRTPAERLKAYREVCDLPDDGTLPPAWLQVLAMPIQTAMLANRAFPLPLPGIVHVSNVIEEHRLIKADEPVDLGCVLEGSRVVRAGVEFDIRTTAEARGEPVWTSVTTAIVRMKTNVGRDEKRKTEPVASTAQPFRSLVWDVPESQGRKYARVSGDWNPIHVQALLARPFGFPRAIAHGLWTFARCLGAIDEQMPRAPRRIEVHFRRPLLLPSVVTFEAVADGAQGVAFQVRARDGALVHLRGSVAPR